MQTRSPMTASERALFALTLLLTAGLALALSAHKLMWSDEFLSFYSDSVPTARDVLNVQLHHPISLDPAAYHLLSHFSMDLFGRTATALRLPALAGFLLMQLSLFSLVRRLAGARAGILAMLLPLLTASFRYAVEGRPYGLLLGLYAAAFTCWFLASQAQTHRLSYLAGLTLSIAAAINSHYFGILILIPIAVAELARIRERRRLDWPMLAAVTLGFASIALILPFQRGLAPYRTHYYINTVSLHAVSQGYRELFVRYTTWPMPLQRLTAATLVAATLALFFAALRRFRSRPAAEPASLWAGLATLALLPLFGFLFGRFVTHSMEVRYVIAALLPFVVVIALLAAPSLHNTRRFAACTAALLLAATALWSFQAYVAARESATTLAALQPSPALQQALAADPAQKLYIQTLGEFFLAGYYLPDPNLRSRVSLVYDATAETTWLHHDTNAVTAYNLSQFAPVSTTPYGLFLFGSGHPIVVLYNDSGWQWIAKSLSSLHVPLTPLGPALGGQAVRVDTPLWQGRMQPRVLNSR